MKRTILIAALVTGLLSSCSTAYKAGQTPDDLYYSPGRTDVAAIKEEKKQKEEEGEYQEYVNSSDDRYLHMRVANRARWSQIDNFGYWNDSRYDFMSYSYYSSFNMLNRYGFMNDPFAYGYGGINPYYNTIGFAGYGGYGAYGYGGYGGYGGFGWSNPMYTLVLYSTPKFSGGTTTSTSGITAYRNKTYSNSNDGYIINPRTGAGSQTSFGNLVKRVFTGSTANNTSSSFDRPVRSFSTAPANSSSNSAPQAPSSSAGGNSGGFKSTGTTTTTGRGGKN